VKPKPQNDGIAAGEPIPGSKYVRGFCVKCGEPVRIAKKTFTSGGYALCSDCTRPFQPGHGTQNETGEYDEHDGAWDNAVRALEDMEDAA